MSVKRTVVDLLIRHRPLRVPNSSKDISYINVTLYERQKLKLIRNVFVASEDSKSPSKHFAAIVSTPSDISG